MAMDFLSYNLANLTANEVKTARSGQATLKARIDAVETQANAAHASKHAPGGTDPLTAYYVQVSDVVTTATAGKILKLDASAKLPASITGDAASVGGKTPGSAAGNLVVIGTDGKIDGALLPAIAITDTFVVADQVAMLALSAQKGDVAVRQDLNKSFILKAEPASTLANWQELLTPTDAVLSVNGKTGVVSLSYTDVSAAPAARAISTAATSGLTGGGDLSADRSLAVNFTTSGGNNGTATTVARGDHTHAAAVANGASGLMTGADKDKLDKIATGAEVNQNAFSNVAVAGQTTVAADAKTDTLTLAAGNGIQITTDAATDTVTITNVAVGANAFGNVAVAGQTSVAADGTNDTLTLAAGAGIQITTDPNTDTVTITNISQGANAFGNVVVGGTTIQADTVGDSLELAAGANISLTPDATLDKVTIEVTGVVQSTDVVTVATANKILKLDANSKLPASITGDANSVGGQTLTNLDSRYAAAGHNHDAAYVSKTAASTITAKVTMDAVNGGRLVLPVGANMYAT